MADADLRFLLGKVLDAARSASEAEIMPRWRDLGAGDAREKGPGDWVTVADEAAEESLRRDLTRLLPGVPTVGEEEAGRDPAVLDRLSAGDAWIIDPVDGTRPFVEGLEGFGVIVCLTRRGRPVLGCILDCANRTAVGAVAGSGAFFAPAGGRFRPLSRPGTPVPVGLVSAAFAEAAARWVIGEGVFRPPGLPPARRAWCSARDYADLAMGLASFQIAVHDKPWDHAAGALIVQELGGRVTHLDGMPYTVSRRGAGVAASLHPGSLEPTRRAWLGALRLVDGSNEQLARLPWLESLIRAEAIPRD